MSKHFISRTLLGLALGGLASLASLVAATPAEAMQEQPPADPSDYVYYACALGGQEVASYMLTIEEDAASSEHDQQINCSLEDSGGLEFTGAYEVFMTELPIVNGLFACQPRYETVSRTEVCVVDGQQGLRYFSDRCRTATQADPLLVCADIPGSQACENISSSGCQLLP